MFKNILIVIILYSAPIIFANQSYGQLSLQQIIPLVPKKTELEKFIFNRHSQKLPEIIVRMNDDNNKSIVVPNGALYLLNFWATWCAPCRVEMPALDALQKELGDDKFKVITIASGRNNIEEMKQFFSSANVTNLTLYRDPKGKTASALGVIGLPTTILIGAKNVELARLIGTIDWADPKSITFFADLKQKLNHR